MKEAVDQILLYNHTAATICAEKFKQLGAELPTPNDYRTASGAPGKAYWQQRVDYAIDVTLDDRRQRITGSESITYHNNSPDTLRFLWLQLDQNIFAGVGNIIKNEVLFRIRVHPENKVKDLPPRKLTEMVNEACIYSYDFLEWKKAFVLKKHWLAHTKRICPRCDIPLKKAHLGRTNRRSFFCDNCQPLYT